MSKHWSDFEYAKERMKICESCQSFHKFQVCKKCGCFMPLKIAIKSATCPLDKW